MAEQAQVALHFCMKHPAEEMDMYCKRCKKPICNECVKTDHMGHDFDSIAKLYRKINNKRSDLISNLERQISVKGSHNRECLQDAKNKNEESEKTNMEKLKKKRAEINKTFNALLDSHEHSLNSHSTKLRGEIGEKETAYGRDESAVLDMVETFKKTTMKGLDLIEYYEDLKSKVHALPTVDISQCFNEQIYLTSQMDREVMQKITGEVRENNRTKITFQLVASFRHRKSKVHTICPVSCDETWITFAYANKFELIRRDGHCIKNITKDAKSHSFILQNNSFLLCNRDDANILRIDMSKRKSVWKDTTPLLSGFIGHALQGNILITLEDEYSGTRTDQSQRMVQMVTPSGSVLHTYEYGEDESTPVLTRPEKVIQNYNSDVCVVNQYEVAKNIWLGNVCVFFEDGGMKVIYRGNNQEFNPRDICCNSMCNIICANYVDSTIHIISSEGLFMQYLLNSDTCVSFPHCLALHRDVLWVGSGGGEVRVYKLLK